MSKKTTITDFDYSAASSRLLPDDTLRVVVGLFDRPAGLIATLQDLTSREFTASKFCVLGLLDSVRLTESILRNKPSIDSGFIDLFLHTEHFVNASDTQAVIGSRGSFLSELRRNEITELKSDFKRGLVALVTKATIPGQLKNVSGLFLRHSCVVQTHEFARN